MTNESQSNTENTSTAFGARLQAAREALGLDTKDAAARLRLNEKVILMMEKERYADDLPVTFIRGYIRAYAKLLQIPEYEVKKALEPIKAKTTSIEHEVAKKNSKPAKPVTSDNYSMQISTYFIGLTMVGLVGAWWYSHGVNKETSAGSSTFIAESQLLTTPSDTIQSTVPPLALNAASGAPEVQTSPLTTDTEANNPTNAAVAKPALPIASATEVTATTPTAPSAVAMAAPAAKPRPKAPVEDIDDEETD